MLGLDFRPFHLLLRWRNAHLAQPNSAFAALNQAKIIENRLASPKPDRLLVDIFPDRTGASPACSVFQECVGFDNEEQ